MTEMRYYVMVFLRTGPKQPASAEEKKSLQQGHFANMERLHAEGKLVLAGPFQGAGDLEGLFLFDTESLEEARAWCDSDPAIAFGSLQADLVKWYSAKGIGIAPQAGAAAPESAA